MSQHEDITLALEAEARLPTATAQLWRISLARPTGHIRREQATYRLDLGLTPRPANARACYRERWGRHRFEKIGPVLMLPPGETVETRSDAIELQRSVVCNLRPEPLREWFDGDLKWTNQALEAGLDIRDANIRNLLLRMGAELEHPGLASEMLLGLIAGQLAIELGRYCTTFKAGASRGGLAPWRLRLIDERLAHVRAAPTLPELAQLCNLSIRALTRGFRASKGVSLGEYVASRQLEQARRLLASGESVKSVAYALGFASSASFCYAFRHAAGEAPGKFRERVLRDRGLPSEDLDPIS